MNNETPAEKNIPLNGDQKYRLASAQRKMLARQNEWYRQQNVAIESEKAFQAVLGEILQENSIDFTMWGLDEDFNLIPQPKQSK